MSGGSYDYLYTAGFCKMDNYLSIAENLKGMAMDMRSEQFNDAADEIDRLALDIDMHARMLINRFERLAGVMHDWEWYKSCDYGKNGFENGWKEFLEGNK
jgi:hypothetical protein